ncbi:hypothetical protein KFV02_06105 [Desulfohalobiaceae bacterium Ax17]|jgi:hypothetical protein|uniref:hypothetical protein n=1 Tax=Desulfovulcanus ferrireducens TaxID=2831190 RepID=UPI00207B9B86|nr:hypothetical protein [Desulfovulcanus ferrireducens]MBT8763503.1 hypothetical protein [Desulfovulcanus ferrireducens]
MDKMLRNLAEKLNQLDEASLMSLWEKYYERVKIFSPSKRWEEDVLILSMIQSVRWKNQLFNHLWAKPDNSQTSEKKNDSPPSIGPVRGNKVKKAGKVLSFRSPQND